MMTRKTLDKKFICPCCMRKTNNFYVIEKTGYRRRYCKECIKKYTTKERRNKEFENIHNILFGNSKILEMMDKLSNDK